MSPVTQTLLSRFAVATSVFALMMVGVVAANSSGSSGDAPAATASAPVPLALTEFALSPATVTVPQGGALQLSNNGSVVHNVSITGTAIKSTDLDAGASEVLDVSELEPGTYEIFCAIPGHKESGMTGTLVVSDGTATSTDAATAAAAGDHGTTHDIASLEPTDEMAKRINAKMEDAMDAGVQEFLGFAEKYAAGDMVKGNAPLEPEVAADGTKVFRLTSAITDWQVSPGKVVKAWTYNGIVPGPWIRVEPGERMRVEITNNLPISTDIHWHGIDVPNDQDGVAGITQPYIRPYETYTYEFTAPNKPQLAMYHAHYHGQEAVLNGMFAVVQVGDVPMPDPGTYGQFEVPADLQISQEIPMVLNDAGVIGLSLNGKAFPETEPIVAKQGEYVLLHYYNEGLAGHPMHLHRQPHLVVAKDGFPLEAPYQVDTLWVSPGERYSVLIKAEEVGTWAFHCHILNHAESDDGLMGMVTAMIVQ